MLLLFWAWLAWQTGDWLYVAYDVAYRLSPRVAVRGQLSYGPRDGVAHFGGGVGTALSF